MEMNTGTTWTGLVITAMERSGRRCRGGFGDAAVLQHIHAGVGHGNERFAWHLLNCAACFGRFQRAKEAFRRARRFDGEGFRPAQIEPWK